MRMRFLPKLMGLFLLTLLFCASSYAQIVKVTGVVKDDTGQPMPGVNVSVKGKPSNVSTNKDGMYVIQADPANDALVFSFIGYKRQTISLDKRATLNVSMDTDQGKLDEVVVIGYGTKKRSQVIGAVATINAEEIADVPSPDIAGALRNRIAGVGVSAVSGAPGAAISLNIRSARISGTAATVGATTEPLYVIDGITSSQSQFDMLDPSMVEDITILKDASAAIYGASGSKGVVLVTTKRGKIGKPKFSYNGYVGYNDASRKAEMMSAYQLAQTINDMYDQQGFKSESGYFTNADLEYLKTHNYKSWFDEIWQASVVQRHNLTMSGGTDKLTFFVGGSFQNNNANYKGTYYNQKYSMRSGITATFSESFKADIGFNINYNKQYTNLPVGASDQNYVTALLGVPEWVPLQMNGLPVNFNSVKNPLAQAQSGFYDYSTASSYTLNTSLIFTPKAIPGLTLRAQIGQTSSWGGGEKYEAPYKQYTFATSGSNGLFYRDSVTSVSDGVSMASSRLTPKLSKGTSYQGNITLNYAKTFGKHSFSALVGGEQSQSNSSGLSVYWTGQQVANQTDFWAFNAAAFTNNGYSLSESLKQSFFGRFSYDYQKKYLIDGVGRFDGSANFAKGNVWGFFPNVGVAWIVSEENFFKNASKLNFVSFLKIKANIGLTGDDRVDNRLWQANYSLDLVNGGYLLGNASAIGPSFNPSKIPNPDITWSKKRTYNIGLETAFFNGKLSFGFDYFHDYTYDDFDKNNDSNFPQYAGFAAPVINHYEQHTYGTEFTFGYNGKLAKDFTFSSSLNFGFTNGYTSQVYGNPFQLFENTPEDWQIELGTNRNVYNSSNIGLIAKGILRTQADVDALLKQYPNYTLPNGSANVVPEVGWLYYEDTNGDGKITDKDQVPLYKNGTDPIITLGSTLSLNYKGFQLRTNFVAKIGGHEMLDSKVVNDKPSITHNVPAIWGDHWSRSNPNGKFPSITDPTSGLESSFWMVDATMIRINNMSLAYTIPASISQRAGISNLRFLLTGNNLWVIKNPQPFKDPYSGHMVDYPTIRTIQLGFGFGF
ncbi:SusC/RagA family TonB-linked outer membrane protein [Mucilaginibacter sp. HMF5004]|uniref:SusC/RagA family TonB-linked outer membrane protein n=1 Tax=Mucilaginibacter rivuli TaxID=2857527 RepID=UPI001C5E0288|nr:SusC/RagA family TonB-linked outer membrane protein [Mucilaginibacter rivuli]MBW4891878.1 SusC/RagA family TonB-linked outer membrane protein [Mucilaginibacter rivuli]